MRRRRLKRLWRRLQELQRQDLSRDQLLLKLGAAKKEAGRAYGLVKVHLPEPDQAGHPRHLHLRPESQEVAPGAPPRGPLPAALQPHRARIRPNCGAGTSNSPRSNRRSRNSRAIWASARSTTSATTRIEAHIFVAFLAYCLQVTLKARLRPLAPGLTPRAVLDNFAAIQMVDVHLPTTDGRTLILSRYTEPEQEQRILLDRLRLTTARTTPAEDHLHPPSP